MKTIKSLDEIRNIDRHLYVRWSRSITLDNKRGHSLAYGTQTEAGLSCCTIDQTWSDWRILRQLAEYSFCGGSCWIISGDENGRGADNEELLINVELVGKVAENLLALDWHKMKNDEDIRDYQDRLTRITDIIGKKIVEQKLKELLATQTRVD